MTKYLYCLSECEELLGVSQSNIKEYGAVSREVVIEMAKNTIKKSQSKHSVSIATTGVAGPEKSEKKPVGLVWIASYRHDHLTVREMNFGNLQRTEIRQRTVLEALKLLEENLQFNRKAS